jgi:crotonobetaine/carnitine-CoA ligase
LGFVTVPELLQSAVERFGDAPAIVSVAGVETFAELGDAVVRAAGALRARGVDPDDRVLIAAPNSAALIHVWLGAIWAGAIPAAVNPASTPSELDYFVADLEPKLTPKESEVDDIGSSSFSLPPDQSCPSPLVGEAEGGGSFSDPFVPAAIIYTSGTTSRPKGVLVRHAAYTESGRSFAGWIGLSERERLWICLPLFHINAQAYSLMSALAHGFSLAVSAKFHASTFWQEAGELQVTSVNVVGAMLDFIARQPVSAWVPSTLRTIYTAPGPHPDERRSLEARFRVRIVSGYGMSENPFGCAESPTSRDKPGSVGRSRQPASRAFENRLRIVHPDGQDVSVGEVGELWFQNPVMTSGYWNAPEITRSALEGGWLHTGDAGRRDDDGDVFLTGRYKEMIRRRGENIAPAEVEEALRAHEAVDQVAVIGVAAGLQEEEVIAIVVRKPGSEVDEASLKEFATGRLAPFKIPSRIAFRESLPMTPTHRVARDVLRREYGAG